MKTTIITKTALIVALGWFLNTNKTLAQNAIDNNPTVVSNDFSNALGVRFGATSGLTFKHKFNTYNSMELILGGGGHHYGLTGLYERNVLTGVNGLGIYFGAGGHIGGGYYRTWGYYDPYYDRVYYRDNYYYGPVIGVDAIAGIEYKIPKAPLALSLDMKPYVEFNRWNGTYFNLDPGLGIKFTF